MKSKALNPVGKLISSMPLHLPIFVTAYKKSREEGRKKSLLARLAPATTRRFGERWSTTNWTSAWRSDLRAEGVLISRRFQLRFRRGPGASRKWRVNSGLTVRDFFL